MIRTVTAAAILSIFCLPGGTAQARASDEVSPEDPARGKTALLQPAPGRQRVQPGSPHLLDSDRDGTISLMEATAHYSWLFELLDRNGDGIIHAAEFIEALAIRSRDPDRFGARRAHLQGLFLRLDSDGDGAVYREQFLIACNAHFSSSDGDGDGSVSVGEFHSRRPL